MKHIAFATALILQTAIVNAADLAEVYGLAQQNDPGLQAARANRDAALESKPLARSQLLPEVVVAVGPHDLARLAAAALAPKPEPTISLDHVHAPAVSVREQATLMVERLRTSGVASFRALTADCPTRHHVVARFLGLLELYLGLSGNAPGIANFAHLGGMLFGFLTLRYWAAQRRR